MPTPVRARRLRRLRAAGPSQIGHGVRRALREGRSRNLRDGEQVRHAHPVVCRADEGRGELRPSASLQERVRQKFTTALHPPKFSSVSSRTRWLTA